jgi:hypothetical protein
MLKRMLPITLALMVAAGAAQAGTYYEAVTRGEGGRGAKMADSTVHAWIDGDNAKIQFVESENPIMGNGTYLITKDGGKTVYLVNPKEKTYATWDMDAMMNFAGGAMKMMNMKFSEPKVEELGHEAGAAILGMPTTHYSYRTSYTMSMSFMGMKNETRTVSEQQIWATPKLAAPAFGVWLRKTPPSFGGNEDLQKLVKAEMEKVHGIPLKVVTKTTSTNEKKGTSETSTTTMEVTKLDETSIPASTFEIPSGYKETQLFPGGEGEGKGQNENPLMRMFGGKKKDG